MTFDYGQVIGKTISFSIYPAGVLPNDYQNVQVQAVLNANIAQRLGFDIQYYHRLVYPTVPGSVGMPNDPTQYNYIEVLTSSGDLTFLGVPWIDETTIVVETGQVITAVVPGVTTSDIPIIKQALAMQGYKNVSIGISPAT